MCIRDSKIPSEVQNNIVRPSKGTSGSVITWESSDPDVISKDGKVTRPEIGEENKKVTLTATAAYTGISQNPDSVNIHFLFLPHSQATYPEALHFP